jgi:hypothetical protein
VCRRVDVRADDIAKLGGEVRVVRELELAHAVRLQAVSPPDALHRADADRRGIGHGGGGPVRRLAGWVILRQRDDPFDDLTPERRHARGPRLVAEQPVDTGRHEPLLPAPDRCLALAGSAHDLDRAVALGGQQDDPSPPDMLLRAVPIRHDRFQASTVGGAQIDGYSMTHAPDSHASAGSGIHLRILPSGFIH